MSFDLWIHLLELSMVVGIGAVVIWTKRRERRRE